MPFRATDIELCLRASILPAHLLLIPDDAADLDKWLPIIQSELARLATGAGLMGSRPRSRWIVYRSWISLDISRRGDRSGRLKTVLPSGWRKGHQQHWDRIHAIARERRSSHHDESNDVFRAATLASILTDIRECLWRSDVPFPLLPATAARKLEDVARAYEEEEARTGRYGTWMTTLTATLCITTEFLSEILFHFPAPRHLLRNITISPTLRVLASDFWHIRRSELGLLTTDGTVLAPFDISSSDFLDLTIKRLATSVMDITDPHRQLLAIWTRELALPEAEEAGLFLNKHPSTARRTWEHRRL